MSSAMITTKLGRVLATGVGAEDPEPPQPIRGATRAAAIASTIVPRRPMRAGSMTSNRGRAKERSAPSRSTAPSSHELVAEAVHGEDVLGRARVGLQLAPQPGHVHVHRARGGHRVVAPDLVQELVPREGGAALADQVAQELEL